MTDELTQAIKSKFPGAEVTIQEGGDDPFDLSTGETLGESADLPPLDPPTASVARFTVTSVWRHPDYGRAQTRIYVEVEPSGLSVSGGNTRPLGAMLHAVALEVEQQIRASAVGWEEWYDQRAATRPGGVVKVARKEEPKAQPVTEL